MHYGLGATCSKLHLLCKPQGAADVSRNVRPAARLIFSVSRRAWLLKYSRFTEVLPTRAFLVPLDEDEEIEVVLGKGQSVNVKYKACGELQPDGKRYVVRVWC